MLRAASGSREERPPKSQDTCSPSGAGWEDPWESKRHQEGRPCLDPRPQCCSPHLPNACCSVVTGKWLVPVELLAGHCWSVGPASILKGHLGSFQSCPCTPQGQACCPVERGTALTWPGRPSTFRQVHTVSFLKKLKDLVFSLWLFPLDFGPEQPFPMTLSSASE